MTQTISPPSTPLISATVTAATSSTVNVRQQPSTDAPVIGQVKVGDSIRYHNTPVTGGSYKLSKSTRSDWYALDVGWLACGVVMLTASNALDTPSTKLTVPFVSQSGTTANHFNEDCGPACCVMVARYYYTQKKLLDPVNFTVNDFASKTALATNDIGLTGDQLVLLLRGYGLNAQMQRPLTLDDLAAAIRANIPPIPLVNYKDINLAHPGDLGHFIVLFAVGQKGFWYHDPYLLGANQYVTNAQLSKAMLDVSPFTSFPNQAVLISS